MNLTTVKWKSLASCLIVVTSLGCSGLDCTVASCGDTLIVNLTGVVPTEFFARFAVVGGGTTVIHCPPDLCRTSVPFDGSPEEVEVTILDVDQNVIGRGVFRPQYGPFRPNGPKCPPECRTAEVALALGAPAGGAAAPSTR